jgi:hypothetical protein
MPQFYSQAHQDEFVSHILKNKRNGYFIDIGCSDPVNINNSYFFETELEWNGLCIDIIPTDFSMRKAKFYNRSALDINYKELFDSNNVPKVIDYMSLDIDCPYTLDALKLIVKATDYEFRVMTVEHDWCNHNDRLIYRSEQRRILEELGYQRLVSDVWLYDYGYFEDWWVNPKHINVEEFSYLKCEKLHCGEIIQRIK